MNDYPNDQKDGYYSRPSPQYDEPPFDEPPVRQETPPEPAPAPMQAPPVPETVPTENPERGNAAKGEIYKEIPKALAGGQPHNVRVHRAMTSDRETPADESLAMPTADVNQNQDLVSKFPNLAKEAPKSDAEWLDIFMTGISMIVANRQYNDALSREGSDWRQGMVDGTDIIRSTIPKFQRPTGQNLTGDSALQNAISYLGLGDVFSAGMWNSGFWVTFTPAPEVAWIELNRILGSEEIRLGRSTYGLAHSGSTSLTQQTIVNFIMKYVYCTSVKANEMAISDIPNYLSVHDVNSFIWGFIAANFPHGFVTERSCITDPTRCKQVVEETLELTELQVVDNSQLTDPGLRAHMRKRGQGTMTLQSVQDYQERLAANSPHVYEVKSGSQKTIRMKMKVPTAAQEFERGQAHVDMVTQAVQRTVTQDTSFRERQRLLNEFFVATEMCIYQHWVSSIEFNENEVTQPDDIQNLLGVFSKDSAMRGSYLDAVTNYIDKSVVSLIAMTPLVCPNCGAVHSRKSEASPELQDVIPFDVVHVFSRLAEFKTVVIRARANSSS